MYRDLAYLHLHLSMCVCHSGWAICASNTSKEPSLQKYLADKWIIESILKTFFRWAFCFAVDQPAFQKVEDVFSPLDQGYPLLCFLYTHTAHTHREREYVSFASCLKVYFSCFIWKPTFACYKSAPPLPRSLILAVELLFFYFQKIEERTLTLSLSVKLKINFIYTARFKNKLQPPCFRKT